MNYSSIIPAFDFREMVISSNGRVVTTSIKIASYFCKAHKNILRTIKRLELDCSPEFNRLNFEPVEYLDKKGEMRLMYNITKDGWMMLVMGFTGKAATAIKEQYIAAFNWMADTLSKDRANLDAERNAVMLEYMKEKDVASMSGRLLNRWGQKTKPRLIAKIKQLESKGQMYLPGV
ncbi:TPA: Rha family transcriptional regulator [Salmonella enterica]|nr:Rha family transcriptional regulator [Salmonella enterica]